MKTAQPFQIPQGMSISEQRDYCLSIIQKQREEFALLREEKTYCDPHHNIFDEILQHWKNKYQKEHEEKEKLEKEHGKLLKNYGKLKKVTFLRILFAFLSDNFLRCCSTLACEARLHCKSGNMFSHITFPGRTETFLWLRHRPVKRQTHRFFLA
jgi:hypothetical protein